MALSDLPRLLRTIGHLRPSQLFWRGRYAVRRRFLLGSRAGRNGSEPPRVPDLRADFPSIVAVDHSPPDERVDALCRGVFQHLNVARELGRPPDWLLGPCTRDRLWTVTLHYHRWAYELALVAARGAGRQSNEAAEAFVDYLTDWIDRCNLGRAGARHLAWNAYATATRIGWWIPAVARLGPAWWAERPEFRARFFASLWKQSAFLGRNIEWDLRGNHLLRDAVGLAWAGRFFAGQTPRAWLRMATELAVDQAREQVLSDGGHFERSPMYHLQVMDDLLTLRDLLEDSAARQGLGDVLRRMTEFARWMRHPDGEIPLLNDAALDGEHPPSAVFERLQRRAFDIDGAAMRGARHFSATGLVVWHGAPWSVFFDVGAIGPDVQPGHAHADTLSFECSYDDVRLFVDPGTHSYDLDDRRAYDRSTAAHNTVCVDRTNSSEVWHIFRVGRRARPFDVAIRSDSGSLDASAAHDGYRHLGNVTHRRRVRVRDAGPLVVEDRVEAPSQSRSSHHVEGGWLLEPAWTVKPSPHGWELRREEKAVRVQLQSTTDLRLTVENRPWHPRFGIEAPTNRLVWRWEGELPIEVRTTVTGS